MFSKSRSLLLAAGLIAAPMATAMAQHNNPAGNMGSNDSVTASPGTADSTAGMNTADSRSTTTSNYAGSAMNSTTRGATGHTVVPGSTSSEANSSSGTDEQKTGATSGGTK
jgi:hypothetical protein